MLYRIPPAGYRLSPVGDNQNRLTPIFDGRNGLSLFGTDSSRQDVRPERSTLTMSDLEQQWAVPPLAATVRQVSGRRCRKTSKIDRAGFRRVRATVAPS
jgi:hypothetical protein